MDNKELWKETLDLDVPLTLEEKQLQIITHYGEEHQLRKLIEEMAELTLAICKWGDNSYAESSIDYLENLLEEMGDVENLIEQFKMLHIDIQKMINDYKIEKVERQLERMAKVDG